MKTWVIKSIFGEDSIKYMNVKYFNISTSIPLLQSMKSCLILIIYAKMKTSIYLI